MNDERYSRITIRETRKSKRVKISSALKPAIIDEVIDKWQSLLTLTTRIADVPSGLIMKLNEDTIEVFVKSQTEGNPYEAGEKAELNYGFYCETVIGTQKKLLVPDAVKSPVWKDNNPDVDLRMISYLGYPVNWPDGEVFGTICILDNKENEYPQLIEDLIFNVKRNLETDLALLVTKKELEEKNILLQELNRTKDKFFSIIAHDLRSPFNSFLGLTKLLAEELPGLTRERIQIMAESLRKTATNLYGLLENLLQWSSMQQGAILYEPKPLLLKATVMSSLELSVEGFNNKKIEIRYNIPEDLVAYADENMVGSIVRNLGFNALKFTPPGGKILITATPLDDRWIEVSFKDTGIGMSREMMDNLFRLDINTSRKGTNKEPSTGLGLIICKDLIEKHAGKLWMESEEGKGSTFHFTLPFNGSN